MARRWMHVFVSVVVCGVSTMPTSAVLAEDEILPAPIMAQASDAAIIGTVFDSSGGPLGGVAVSVYDASGAIIVTAWTDAAGAYTAAGLDAGDYRVGFEPPAGSGHAPDFHVASAGLAEATAVAVGDGATVTLDHTAPRWGRISGTVLDEALQPVSSAYVHLLNPGGQHIQTALTDAAGSYELIDIGPGTYLVRFEPGPSNQRLRDEYHDDALTAETATPLDVAYGSDIDVDAELAVGSIVRGTVTTSSGDPIAGVRVTASGDDGSFLRAAATDTVGAYELLNVPPADVVLRFDPPAEFRPEYHLDAATFSSAERVTVGDHDDVTVDAQLTAFGRVTGVVTDGAGTPAAGALVRLHDAVGNLAGSTSTDIAGAYSLIAPDAGTYRLRFEGTYGSGLLAEWSDDSPMSAGAESIAIADETTIVRNASLDPAGTVGGRVVDIAGQPVANIWIQASDPDSWWTYGALTDATGEFELTGVTHRSPTLRLDDWTGEFRPEYFDDADGPDDAVALDLTANVDVGDITLSRYPFVEGTVTLPDGSPAVGATVHLRYDPLGDGSFYWNATSQLTASDGSYLVRGHFETPYLVSVTSPAGSGAGGELWEDALSLAEADPIPLGDDQSAVANLQLPEEAVIAGHLTTSTGDPASGVTVSAYGGLFTEWRQVVSDEDGYYELHDLSAGEYTLQFWPDDASNLMPEYFDNAASSSSAVPVDVMPGSVAIADAELTRYATIGGTVTGPDGQPVGGVSVQYRSTTGTVVSASTGNDGVYLVRQVPVGAGTFSFQPAAGSGLRGEYHQDATSAATATEITVHAESASTIDAQLGEAYDLRGTVRDASATLQPDIAIDLYDDLDQHLATTTTNAVGEYDFVDVTASAVKVRFTDPSGVFHEEWATDRPSAASADVITLTADTTLDATVNRPGRVEGVVVLDDGTPSPLTQVTLVGVDPGVSVYREVTTNADGQYVIAQVPAGHYRMWFGAPSDTNYLGEFFHDAYAASEATPVEVFGDAVLVVDETLDEGGSIGGVVTDTTGAPVAGVTVQLTDVIHGGSRYLTTDATGGYLARALLPSSYRVQYHPGVEHLPGEYFANVGVHGGEDVAGIDHTLADAGTIVGTVTDADGVPVAGASVFANRHSPGGFDFGSALTRPDGTYTISGLLPGDYVVGVSHGDFTQTYFDGVATEAEATLVAVAGGPPTTADMTMLPLGALIGSITGTVVDADGEPLADVVVRAGVYVDQTDLDGRFVLAQLPDGSYRVSASVAGKATTYFGGLSFGSATPVVVAGGGAVDAIDFILLEEAVITGTVDTSASTEATTVFVSAYDDSSGVSVATYADQTTGEYIIDRLPAGSYRVRFGPMMPTPFLEQYHDGVSTASEATPVHVGYGDIAAGIDATLVLGGTISGRVTTADGQPQPNVTVSVSGPTYASVTTDTNGDYVARALTGGTYTVRFEPPHSSGLIAEYFDDAADAAAATPVAVAEGVATTSIDAVLADGLSIGGSVTQPGGAPAANVAVWIYRVMPFFTTIVASTSTDGEGDYVARGLTPGTYCVAVVNPPDRLTTYYGGTDWCAPAGQLVLTDTDLTGIDIELGARPTISGRVTDAAGDPIAGVIVQVGTGTSGPATVTDSGGHYTLVVPYTGVTTVRFDGSGLGWVPEYYDDAVQSYQATQLTIGRGATIVDVDAVLAIGATIQGRVLDTDGQPVPGVFVGISEESTFDSRSATTAADGTYSVLGLAAGRYRIAYFPTSATGLLYEYHSDAGTYSEADVIALAAGATFVADATLERAGSIAGTVVGPDGSPVVGVSVGATSVGGPSGSSFVNTDAEGGYRIGGLRAGQYLVQFRTPVGSTLASELFDDALVAASAQPVGVSYGEETGDVDAQLAARGSLAGIVLGPDGEPVAGATVALTGDVFCFFGSCPSTTTGPDGEYQLDTVDVGPWAVVVQPPSTRPELLTEWSGGGHDGLAPSNVVVVPGSSTTVDFQLDVGATLHGTVTDTSGDPVAGATVYSDGATDTTDSSGAYELVGLAPGDHVVGAFPPFGSPLAGEYHLNSFSAAAATPVPLALGQIRLLDFELTESATVFGTVTDGTGVAVPYACIGVGTFGTDGESGCATWADEFGAFSVASVPEGAHVVCASGFGLAPECFDDALTPASADGVAVVEGASVGPIELVLAPGGSADITVLDTAGDVVDGRLFATAPGDPTGGTPDWAGYWSVFASPGVGGVQRFDHLHAGEHRLRFVPTDAALGELSATIEIVDSSTTTSTMQYGTGAQVPGAPGTPSTVPSAGAVTLAWSPPSDDGGAPVNDYVVQMSTDAGATWSTVADGTSAVTGAIVTGLTNGTSYMFRVAARNHVGTGSFSSASTHATPRTVPGVPDAPAASASDGSVSLSWVAPSDGGAPIVDYVVQVSADDGTTWSTVLDGVATATELVVGDLDNGTAYVFRVAAVNAAGEGTPSAASAPTTPFGLPGVTGPLSGSAGDARVTLTWSAPADDGGSPVLDYVVEWTADGSTWTMFTDGVATSTGTTVTGLSNGTAYSFRIAAVNAAGRGPVTTTPVPLTPRTVPGAPGRPTATAGDRSVTLAWSPPGTDGGAPISDYAVQVSSNNGASWTTFADGTSSVTFATVTGLANGTAYAFRVAAVNAAGTGAFSAASTPATPASPPSAPGVPTVTVGNAQVSLAWTAPTSTGGRPIVDYVVEYSPDAGVNWNVFADPVSTARTATVTGLTNGTSYVFRVAARNAAATGAFGAVSAPATPRTKPAPVGAPVGARGNTSVSLTWSAPDSGGAAITDYLVQFSTNAGSTWKTFNDGVRATTGATVTGLVNGTPYLFRIAAKNAAGTGAYGPASATVVPAGPPAAPAKPTGTAASRSVSLTWKAPTNTGGSPVTDYVVQFSRDAGATWTTFDDGVSIARSVSVTGLTAGVRHVFRVAAVNAVGTGAFSPKSAAITPRA